MSMDDAGFHGEDLSERLCPRVERAFGLLGRKWMGLVVRSLASGERYFSELERDLPALSARVLSLRLRELEEAGLAERLVHAGPPARVSYRLSEAGAGLQPVIASIEAWAGEAWAEEASVERVGAGS